MYLMNPTKNLWILRPMPNPAARMRIFCFPYAGAEGYVYQQWIGRLPRHVEICCVQLPGRGKRFKEPYYTCVQALVEDLCQAIVPFLDKPFIFFGHSMGAMIGFELCRELRKVLNLLPEHLFVSGKNAPQLSDNEPKICTLPDNEFLEKIGEMNGTPKELLENREFMDFILTRLRADYQLCENYQYEDAPPLACGITALSGVEDPIVDVDCLSAWREHTVKSFKLKLFTGDHFFLHSAQDMLLGFIAQYMC